MATRFQGPRRSSRSRPNRTWTSNVESTFTTIAAGTKVLMSFFVPSNAGIDETVLRTVGVLSVKSDQAAVSEDQIGAFGMIVVNSRATIAGAASLPGPVTDAFDDGWFIYQSFCQSFLFNSAIGVNPDMATHYIIDSKAKRRVESGSDIVVMVENAHATHGISVGLNLRMLSMVTGS